MKNTTKKGLLAFILIFLLLPLVQQSFSFITTATLYGYVDYARNVDFSWSKYFDGSYQQDKSKYLNDWTGFRPDLVRLNNQLDFSLFKKLDGGATLGSGNCLYYDNYIDAYTGTDFVGDKTIREKLLKLKAIQDTLAHLGKTFILIHSPNKAFFYPEYLPARYLPRKKENNLQSYLRIGDSLGINQIDLNGWFISMKDTSKNLLMSKQGIHWTLYGAFIAGDSIARYLEKSRNIHMLHPIVTKIQHTRHAQEPDDDINRLQNMIVPVAHDTFSYPEFTYPDDTTKTKPRVIFIGDSFIINMIKNWTLQGITKDWQFWFYFKYLMNKDNPVSGPDNPLIQKCDWTGQVDKTDCVILMYTSPCLPHLGDSFIEQAYDHYYPKK